MFTLSSLSLIFYTCINIKGTEQIVHSIIVSAANIGVFKMREIGKKNYEMTNVNCK